MTDKELAEIRRRFKPEKTNINAVHGCCVDTAGEIFSTFEIPLMSLEDEQREWLLKLMKKPVTGAVGRNLMTIDFTPEMVSEGAEHKLLSDVRDCELQNEEIMKQFYEKIISCYSCDTMYLILTAYDVYDVPSFSKNEEELEDSREVFRYFVCAVCPLKVTKTGLGFATGSSRFLTVGNEVSVAQPEIGFMFPAFDERSTNIYNALFYTKSISENHATEVEALFGTQAQMPPAEQKETFRTLISSAAPESCSLEFVQSVNHMISDIITEHKESHDPEPLVLDKNDVRRVLTTCGAGETEMADFDEKYAAGFGEDTAIAPQNIVDQKNLELKNSYVSIKVDPQFGFMVNTRIIDGVKYVMVRADEGVQVNGVSIRFDGEAPESTAAEAGQTVSFGNLENTAETTAASSEPAETP